eukprot:GHVP01015216.1.p1 GENE.GHVP01015216.1~~GHVP01015216.1.p1  ORF type:complete len:309 (-),score=21.97 GHVP01015216.1:342-1181(-)
MKEQVKIHIQNCQSCQEAQARRYLTSTTRNTLKGALHHNLTWEHLGIDIATMEDGARPAHFIIAIDHHSRFIITKAIDDLKSATTAIFLVQNVCYALGTPTKITTDNATSFQGYFTSAALEMGIELQQPPPLHPEQNGMVERVIKSLKEILHAHQWNQPWHKFIKTATGIYNHAYHSSIKQSPLEALLGRRHPALICPELPTHEQEIGISPSQWAEARARTHMNSTRRHEANAQNRREYESRHHAIPRTNRPKIGDRCKIRIGRGIVDGLIIRKSRTNT